MPCALSMSRPASWTARSRAKRSGDSTIVVHVPLEAVRRLPTSADSKHPPDGALCVTATVRTVRIVRVPAIGCSGQWGNLVSSSVRRIVRDCPVLARHQAMPVLGLRGERGRCGRCGRKPAAPLYAQKDWLERAVVTAVEA
jgi:hypothetical protein